MGKIFGISDLPVSTIMTPFEPVQIYQPPIMDDIDYVRKNPCGKAEIQTDKYVSTKVAAPKSNPIINMRNGIGRFMKHFSKKI